MKILMISYQFPPALAGVADYTSQISKELIKSYNFNSCYAEVWSPYPKLALYKPISTGSKALIACNPT